MKIKDQFGNVWICIKCKMPKFSEAKGATWDFTRHTINNIPVEIYLDTTWGQYYYFEYEKQWYKFTTSAPMFSKYYVEKTKGNCEPVDNTINYTIVNKIKIQDTEVDKQYNVIKLSKTYKLPNEITSAIGNVIITITDKREKDVICTVNNIRLMPGQSGWYFPNNTVVESI